MRWYSLTFFVLERLYVFASHSELNAMISIAKMHCDSCRNCPLLIPCSDPAQRPACGLSRPAFIGVMLSRFDPCQPRPIALVQARKERAGAASMPRLAFCASAKSKIPRIAPNYCLTQFIKLMFFAYLLAFCDFCENLFCVLLRFCCVLL